MNVGELKKILGKLKDNAVVLMAADAEGNSYKEVISVDVSMDLNTVRTCAHTSTLKGPGEKNKPAAVLWPCG